MHSEFYLCASFNVCLYLVGDSFCRKCVHVNYRTTVLAPVSCCFVYTLSPLNYLFYQLRLLFTNFRYLYVYTRPAAQAI